MNLLAIDPGLHYPAAALFKDGVLVVASRVKIPAACHKLPIGQRCLEVARLIRAWVYGHGLKIPIMQPEPHPAIDELITEWPRCYTRMKGDPADLFPLAGVGMCLAGMFNVPTVAPTAPEWIGNIPKTTTGDPLASIRAQRVWSRLSEAERSCVVLSHDAIDAVGLGLFKLSRLETRKGFIGATR